VSVGDTAAIGWWPAVLMVILTLDGLTLGSSSGHVLRVSEARNIAPRNEEAVRQSAVLSRRSWTLAASRT
jgi:hypothetical protein